MDMLNGIDLTRVDLNLLVLFEAVFEERHVGAASTKLHVSSSAVSHGLRRLRDLFDDPLFLRTPKGVVPTVRATELAAPIGEILARVRGVVGSVTPFDPPASTRRFSIGAPDTMLAVLLPPLMALLQRDAPRIDLSTRHLLPQSWIGDLDSGTIDVVILPLDEIPARFFSKVVFDEEFVIAARKGHAFLKAPTLRRYCEQQHIVVSLTGDSSGHVDQALAERGLSRRVALSVPNFLLALATLSETDLVAAIPTSLARTQAERFGLESVKAPLPLKSEPLRAIAPKAAMADPGIAWLFDVVCRSLVFSAPPTTAARRKRR
jgi:DNA-binding transcriptional LysR family regulator